MVPNDEKLKRLVSWFEGKPSPPFKIVLNPTNRCNLNCVFCPNALSRSEAKFRIEDEISDEAWLKTVNDGLRVGVREWSIIGGGEPLLRHEAVFSMINSIKTFGKETDCELITNGTLLRKEDIRRLVEIKMDRILFSIDAPDAEIHNYFRGVKNTFEKSTTNLKAIHDMKNKLGMEKPYLKVNMVLNNKNYRSIARMIKFVKMIGGQEIALHPMREYNELNPQIQHLKMNGVQEDEMKTEIIRAEKLSKELGIFLNRDMIDMETGNSSSSDASLISRAPNPELVLWDKIMRTNCFEPLYSLFIDPNGNVAHCSPAGRGYEDLNVKEKSIEDIWYSEKLSSIRKLIMSGGSLDCCLKCGLIDMKENIRKELTDFLGEPSEV